MKTKIIIYLFLVLITWLIGAYITLDLTWFWNSFNGRAIFSIFIIVCFIATIGATND